MMRYEEKYDKQKKKIVNSLYNTVICELHAYKYEYHL